MKPNKEPQYVVLLGEANDLGDLEDRAATGRCDFWSSLSRARKGAFAFIYLPGIGICATATLAKDPERDGEWQFGTTLKDVVMVPKPVGIKQLKRTIPEWRWLRFPRKATYLDTKLARKLLRLITVSVAEPTQMDANVAGSGFGKAEQNKLVEEAAYRFVTEHYERRGWAVTARQNDKCGYDLEVTKAKRTRCIEVKGVTGQMISFPITANEVNCSKKNTRFVLAVVTRATSKEPLLHEFTGAEFVEKFRIQPYQFIATLM
jgi:hypothetical protein